MKRTTCWALGASCAALAVSLAGCPRVDSLGWFHIFGEEGDDAAYALARTEDGGFVLAGFTEDSHDEDDNVLLVKLERDGEQDWRVELGDDREDTAYDVAQAQDGGYIVAGRFGGPFEADADGFLLKTDATGEEEWRTLLDDDGNNFFTSVAVTPEGEYLATAQLDALGESEAVVVRIDADGNEVDRDSLGAGANAVEVVMLEDGSSVAAAWRLLVPVKQLELGTGIELLKLDAQGEEIWRRTVVSEVAAELRSIALAQDGGIVLCGQSDFFNSDSDAFLWKTDSLGEIQWRRTYGESGRETFHSVQASRSGFILAGEVDLPGELPHALLLRTDNEGDLIWKRAYGGADRDAFHDVAVLSSGYFAVGESDSFEGAEEASHSDVLIARTARDGSVPLLQFPLD